MAGRENKKKLLYLLKILLEQTDDSHVLSASQLCEELEKLGIDAERKSIYSDIAVLEDFGIDIIHQKGRPPGFYIGSRTFELPELKLLIDAVQASRFITTKKSDELISKLKNFTSKYEAQKLQRNVFINNRAKNENETIYYNINEIHSAIFENVQIQFQYSEWTVKKERKLRKNGAFYIVSPWLLTWSEEHYYLLAYEAPTNAIKHYRVDKMHNISLLPNPRLGQNRFHDFSLAAFSKKTFSMYSVKEQNITLECDNSLAGVILDRFGMDTMLIPFSENSFHAPLSIDVSPQFFGWLTGLAGKAKIIHPESVRKEFQTYLKNVLECI